jgi:beta-N-acetylhexosaminidase
MNMSLGPLCIDIDGYALSEEDREVLRHPLVGGVILFTSNYLSIEQLTELVTDIHTVRQPSLLVTVDHEGGRVQRFREHFCRLPAAAKLGRLYDKNPQQALRTSEVIGWLLATELRAVGVDFSFAPVLDIETGISTVIGDRAFHSNPVVVAELGCAVMRGMQSGGMIAVGKHFPGHGSVAADSHHAVPMDERLFTEIQSKDLIPFAQLINLGLPAIMPAHIIYEQIDPQPVGFSRYWLTTILRRQLGFNGAIISDDLSMAGATVVGDVVSRTRQALQAGCDMVLICHDRPGVLNVLDQLSNYHSPLSQVHLNNLQGHPALDWHTLHQSERWRQAQETCHWLASMD